LKVGLPPQTPGTATKIFAFFARILLVRHYARFSDKLKTGVPQTGQLYVQKNLPNGLKNDQRIKRIVPTRRDKTLCKNKAFKSVGRFSIRWARKKV
jgi:hypothetical protein